jgi:hypothetical protein
MLLDLQPIIESALEEQPGLQKGRKPRPAEEALHAENSFLDAA